MRRFTWLFGGLILGAMGMFVSMKYYVVRADSGIHLIPKATAQLSMPYVDIRSFDIADWDNRRDLALAIVQADKPELLQGAAVNGLRQTMEGVLQSLHAPHTELR